jgi:aminopeptidase
MSEVPEWIKARQQYWCDTLPARLHIISSDPDGLKGMNMEKAAKARQKTYPIMKPYIEARDGKQQWCIAAVPGAEWAKMVFPGVRTSVAIEKLWQAILLTSRVIDEKGNMLDSNIEWFRHNRRFTERCRILNEAGLRKLVYKSSNGTDLTVGLMPEGSFLGGGEYTLGGEYYNPNIPTEEIFTTPKAGEAEGIVYSSMPLSYRGEIIDNFSIRFEGGRAVEVKAERNEELLKQMVSMDDGAAMLGECALVPYDSPIRNSGIMFFETLFDENAACHFAMGEGFTNTIKNFDKYTREELKEMGVNDSNIHVDFMIGTKDLSIVGIKEDGSEFVIFKGGNWAF